MLQSSCKQINITADIFYHSIIILSYSSLTYCDACNVTTVKQTFTVVTLHASQLKSLLQISEMLQNNKKKLN